MNPKVGDIWYRYKGIVRYAGSEWDYIYPNTAREAEIVCREAHVIAVTPKTVLLKPLGSREKRQLIGSKTGAWKPTKAEAQAALLPRTRRRMLLLGNQVADCRAILAAAQRFTQTKTEG